MFIFPAHILNPDPVKADVVSRVVSGGTALSGEEDVISADGGGRWEISYGEINLDEPYHRRLWDAWTAHLSGGAQTVRVPILSIETAPRPTAGNGLAVPSDICDDDDYFPTEVRFAAPYIVATISAAAAVRATTLRITVAQGAAVQPGMKFAVGSQAFKVERVLSRDGMSATCKVVPPARFAIAAGAAADFDWPTVPCRAVLGQDLAAAISLGAFGTVSVSFVEAVPNGA